MERRSFSQKEENGQSRITRPLLETGLPRIAELIGYLAEREAEDGPCLEIGSGSWIDDGHDLGQITAAMVRFGYEHCPAMLETCAEGCHQEWHKPIRLGGKRALPDGSSPRSTAIEWLEFFSCVLGDISPAALSKFDSGCGGFVDMIKNSKPMDLSEL